MLGLGNGDATRRTFIGLILGIVLGYLLQLFPIPFFLICASLIEPLGFLWARAIQMVLLPLVATQLAAALLVSRGRLVNRMVARASGLFVCFLTLGAVFSVTSTTLLLRLIPTNPDTLASLRASLLNSETPPATATSGISLSGWLPGLFPSNFFAAAISGELLQVTVFILLLGLALNRLPAPAHEQARVLASDLRDAVLLLMVWILNLAPAGVFGLSLALTRQTGLDLVGFLGQFVAMVVFVLLLATLLLYPIAILCGRVGVSAFARALLQGQLVAISTRSSLATVPALLQGARCHLPLPESVLGFMIPFSASSFKLNRTISSLVRLLFVTHIFGITIEATQLMTFVVTVLLLSFSSAGVPTALGATTTLPAYLAAGAPIEGVIFLATAELIPDIFKTLLNTTGYLTVTVVLARWGGLGENEGAPTIEASLL